MLKNSRGGSQRKSANELQLEPNGAVSDLERSEASQETEARYSNEYAGLPRKERSNVTVCRHPLDICNSPMR